MGISMDGNSAAFSSLLFKAKTRKLLRFLKNTPDNLGPG